MEKGKTNGMDPDEIIEDIGGCGRFQIRMSIVIHLIKTIVCFGFSNLIITTKTPSWYCVDESIEGNLTLNSSFVNGTEVTRKEACYDQINKTKCENIVFENGLNTISSEVNKMLK